MIKTTLGNLLAASQPQGEGKPSPIGALANCRAKGAKAMERLRTLEAIEAELTRFQKARNAVIEAYATKSDEGKPVGVAPDDPNYPKVVEEIQALLDAEVNDLPGEQIKVSELGEGELSPLEIRALRFWLVE